MLAFIYSFLIEHILDIGKGIFWVFVAFIGGITLWIVLLGLGIIVKLLWIVTFMELF